MGAVVGAGIAGVGVGQETVVGSVSCPTDLTTDESQVMQVKGQP